MNNVGVIGDRDSVIGFRALGMTVLEAGNAEEAGRHLKNLVAENFAVIFITENFVQGNEDYLLSVRSQKCRLLSPFRPFPDPPALVCARFGSRFAGRSAWIYYPKMNSPSLRSEKMKKNSQGRIVKVSGPLVVAEGMRDANMFDVVRVSDERLIGEIIEMHGDRASIQVYEETAGLGPGEIVESENAPLSVELAPGLIGGIFDGIQRPLDRLVTLAGNNIARGVTVEAIDREKKWDFEALLTSGQRVEGGDILGTVRETSLVLHKIMVPPGISGEIESIASGSYTVTETICRLRTDDDQVRDLSMLQKWPVRRERPSQEKLAPEEPMITGQRIIDTFFPVAKGGTAAVPGPFGSGKTVIQHQLAKWAEADIVVYMVAESAAMR